MSRTAFGPAADETHVGDLSAFESPNFGAFGSFASDLQDLKGTVPAQVHAGDNRSYRHSSEQLTRGRPVQQCIPMTFPQKLSAKDLLAELDSINAQIHRIMFQVERAVARLTST